MEDILEKFSYINPSFPLCLPLIPYMKRIGLLSMYYDILLSR